MRSNRGESWPAFVLVASVASLLLARTPAQSVEQPVDKRFETIAALSQSKMEEHGVPGVALGIIADGRPTTRGLGVTSVDDPLSITPHTVFPIASISKTFAVTAMLRLVEEGTIDLRAPVRKYLPDFRVRDERVSRDVTIWHLLTHTGGWEGQVSGPERGDKTLENFVASISDLMQIAPPGDVWSYNNAGFSIAGRVVEVVTGKSINRAIRELVFTPLGLEHAGTTAGEFITHRFALGHTRRDETPPTLQRPFSPSTSVTAGGVGLCITDLLTYAAFHLGDGSGSRGERVLRRESVELMRTPQLRKQSTDDDMGLGWHLRTIGRLRVAGHGGTLAGHILLLEIVPERNFAIAILTNSNSGWRLIQDVERAALETYLNVELSPNQAIAHRGLVETLPAVEPLPQQPHFSDYAGTYERPSNVVSVRVDGNRLIVQVQPKDGKPQPEMPIAFYGPDRAVITSGSDRGQSIEFVRDGGGQVKWIRVVGRAAVRVS